MSLFAACIAACIAAFSRNKGFAVQFRIVVGGSPSTPFSLPLIPPLSHCCPPAESLPLPLDLPSFHPHNTLLRFVAVVVSGQELSCLGKFRRNAKDAAKFPPWFWAKQNKKRQTNNPPQQQTNLRRKETRNKALPPSSFLFCHVGSIGEFAACSIFVAGDVEGVCGEWCANH